MELLLKIFGEGKDINAGQMCARAVVVFVIALILIRVAGRRSFGLKKPIDNIIVILLGSVLSRAIVGASPFVPTILASFVIVALHRMSSWISIRHRGFSKLVNGQKILLYKDGQFFEDNLKQALTHEDDVTEQVRLRALTDSMDNIDSVYMEKTGEISSVKKEQ